MTALRKVLFISYYYPPYLSPGAIRASKFTRYLPEFGWSCVVLAAENPYPATLRLEIQPDRIIRASEFDVNWLPRQLMNNEKVARKCTRETRSFRERVLSGLGDAYRQFVNFPDGQIGWYGAAFRQGLELIEREKPDLIFSSALPATAHIVAHRLASRTHLPWVAEFRDLWVGNGNFQRVGMLRTLERKLEFRTMRNADALITVSEPLARTLRDRLGKPVTVIPNGYDPEDYPRDARPLQKFTLTYTGILYPRKQDPLPLFEAISALRRKNLITSESFQLRFVGRNLESLHDPIHRFGLDDLTWFSDTVSHHEALRLQMESSVLLLLLWNGPEDKGWYSLKLFEYLGSGRPILAIGPRDVIAAELVSSANAGAVVETARELEHVLLRWIREHQKSGQIHIQVREDVIKAFHRRALTEDLAHVLNGALKAGIQARPLAYHADASFREANAESCDVRSCGEVSVLDHRVGLEKA